MLDVVSTSAKKFVNGRKMASPLELGESSSRIECCVPREVYVNAESTLPIKSRPIEVEDVGE